MAPDFMDFVSHEPMSGCWLWTGSVQRGGYGGYEVRGKRYRANRYSWMLHRGPIPEGMHVCHRCDNPPCVNPDHLFLGTMSDNIKDAARKGRVVTPTQRGGRGWQARKTTCKRGHDFDRVDARGRRVCTICQRAHGAKHDTKRRAE